MTEADWAPGPAWLFCPADRPDRYPKALAAADVVIVDLEDAVAPEAKAAARDALRGLAARGMLDPERTVVRVNAAGTEHHADDLLLTAEMGIRRVMLPKAERPEDVDGIGHEVVVLLESPLGIDRAGSLAEPDNVAGLMWGNEDLLAALGGTSGRHSDGTFREVLRYARSRTLVAAKAHGRLALDTVHLDIADVDGLAAECEDAVAVGFDATVAIHPRQLDVIRAAYAPAEERVAWARRLLDHIGDAGGVSTFEGRMIDGPVVKQAQRLLRLAESTGADTD